MSNPSWHGTLPLCDRLMNVGGRELVVVDGPRQPHATGAAITAILVLAGIVGLTFVARAPTQEPNQSQTIPYAETEERPFSLAPFDRVMRDPELVTTDGLVHYAGLKQRSQDLDAFLEQVKAISPHSNIASFSSENEALAYWLNAYNAWMLRAVLDAYPIDSVKEIEPEVFGAKGRICGGEDLSLNEIEHEIVRKEFLDPRAHFALNCASMGCPWIPQEAFDPARLEQQLDREARRFFKDPDHLIVDVPAKTVFLSPILDWYQEDFLKWLEHTDGAEQSHILQYVRLYAPEDIAQKIDEQFDIVWQDYDWALNDAGASPLRVRAQTG